MTFCLFSIIWLILRRTGLLCEMHTAFLQPLHEAPHHYYNCTEFGLRHWLRRFDLETVRVSKNFNPAYALSWLASELESGFASGVSDHAAASFRDARLGEFMNFWRDAETRKSLPGICFMSCRRPSKDNSQQGGGRWRKSVAPQLVDSRNDGTGFRIDRNFSSSPALPPLTAHTLDVRFHRNPAIDARVHEVRCLGYLVLCSLPCGFLNSKRLEFKRIRNQHLSVALWAWCSRKANRWTPTLDSNG